MNVIEAWTVGILLILVFIRITRFEFKGITAFIFMTVVPYAIGNIVLKMIGYK